MKRYDIYRVEGGKFDQQHSYRPGISSKHAIEVATGEVVSDTQKTITDNKSNISYSIFEDNYGRKFAAVALNY